MINALQISLAENVKYLGMRNIISQSSSYESVDLVRVGIDMYEAAIKWACLMLMVLVMLVSTGIAILYICARYLDDHEFKKRSTLLNVDFAEGCGFTSMRPSARNSLAHRLRSQGMESSMPTNEASAALDEPVFDALNSPTSAESAALPVQHLRHSADHLSVRRVN